MKAMRSHEEATVEMLRGDPALANEYLRAALEEIGEPGGEAGFLAALRQVALSRSSLADIAQATGMKREAVSRALSPRGNPTLKTLTALCRSCGVELRARIATRGPRNARQALPATKPSPKRRRR